MDSYVLDVILIALAIVVLLHLFYNGQSQKNQNNQNKASSEKMAIVTPAIKELTETKNDNINSEKNNIILPEKPTHTYDDGIYRDNGTIGMDRTDCTKKWYHYANRLVTDNNSDQSRQDINREAIECLMLSGKKNKGRLVFEDTYTEKVTSDPFEANMTKHPPTFGHFTKYSDEKYVDVLGNVCSVGEDKLDINRYIRDFVLDGNAQCGCVVDKSKSDFTRDEVDEYREKQIQFRDKINGTSALAVDPVDKMNMITIEGGVKANGQTIADYYDNLVGTGSYQAEKQGPGFILGSPIPSNRCVRPPTFDAMSGVPQGYYTKEANNGGKYITRDNWVYNNENPNNGGVFYDGISGQDPMIESDRMIM